MFCDPALSASISWLAADETYLSAWVQANLPIGQFREGKLAQLALHRWAVETWLALSWRPAEGSWDVSGKVGATFNGTNDITNYNTGTELHFEAAAERNFSPELSAGVQAYQFHQLSGDCGDRAVLGSSKERVSEADATAAYSWETDDAPLSNS